MAIKGAGPISPYPDMSRPNQLRKLACAPSAAQEVALETLRERGKGHGNMLTAARERERLFPRKRKSMNPFIVFRTLACRELAAAHPGISNGEISSLLGKRWHAMPDHEKQQYRDMAKQLRADQAYPVPRLPAPSLKDSLFGPILHQPTLDRRPGGHRESAWEPPATVETLHAAHDLLAFSLQHRYHTSRRS